MYLAILISVVLLFTLTVGLILSKRDRDIIVVRNEDELKEIISDSLFDDEII